MGDAELLGTSLDELPAENALCIPLLAYWKPWKRKNSVEDCNLNCTPTTNMQKVRSTAHCTHLEKYVVSVLNSTPDHNVKGHLSRAIGGKHESIPCSK